MARNVIPRLRTKIGRQSLKHSIAKRLLNPLLRPCGYTIVADHFYQPIPNPREVLLYQEMERPLASLAFDLPRQVEFVDRLLTRHRDEFNANTVLSACGYREATSGIVNGDAEVLYSLIRAKKPAIVIEVGAGGSSQIIAAALKMNAAEGNPRAKLISIDPFPPAILDGFEANTRKFLDFELVSRPVQSVDLALFRRLNQNDLLFIDSSHVFKQGSDVEFEFLQVYPVLGMGVVVHIHDVFFPFDYPAEWNTRECWFWNEQYFLETFLQFNNKFRVLASLSMVSHHQREVFARNIRSFSASARPASFWMETVA